MQIGDKVTYQKKIICTLYDGCCGGEIKEGIIEEILDSINGTYKCFWIKGEPELITEFQIIK